jgi:hypothetical protein
VTDDGNYEMQNDDMSYCIESLSGCLSPINNCKRTKVKALGRRQGSNGLVLPQWNTIVSELSSPLSLVHCCHLLVFSVDAMVENTHSVFVFVLLPQPRPRALSIVENILHQQKRGLLHASTD